MTTSSDLITSASMGTAPMTCETKWEKTRFIGGYMWSYS